MSGPCAQDRLREARGIVADVAHHEPETLALACVVIMALSEDAGERAEAAGLLHLVEEPPNRKEISA